MKTWYILNVNEKINIKQYAMGIYGKRWHTNKPDFCNKLNELQINYLLN
jgi:hypothetical protein